MAESKEQNGQNQQETDAAETEEVAAGVGNLKLYACIGFDGNTIHGLRAHPNGVDIVYPTGNKVVIKNMQTQRHDFLAGHTNSISALDISRSGLYVASGQINHIGFLASVILWDFHKRELLAKHESHKVRVEAVVFSAKDDFLLSLGGRDCGSVVVWDIKLKKLICSTEASRGTQGDALVLYPMNCRDPCFMTGGDGTLMVWTINPAARAISGTPVSLAKLKRKVLCMAANDRDEICFCGTSTGDVLKLRLNFHHDVEILEPQKLPMMIGCFTKISKKPLPAGTVELYQMGIRSIILTAQGELVIGAGDGTVELVVENPKNLERLKKPASIAYKLCTLPEFKVIRTAQVKTAVTSLVVKDESTMYAGTQNCEVFLIDFKTFVVKLLITCHTTTIYDVAFPDNFPDVFATAGEDNIRIWSTRNASELLRIMVPNFTCSKVLFTCDGKAILSAWNDGVIRAFTPLTGRLMYAIMNAHNKGVSALSITKSGRMIISGGCEGQVRVWDIKPSTQKLICTLKEHKGPVSSIHINNANDEAVSASTDGSCIIWDIVRFVRRQVIFANTLFMTVAYHPTDVQILTAGSDKKICYWEVLDGSLVRDLEGSSSSAVNTINISGNGVVFASGGNDQIIRVWNYQGGNTTHIGVGHCSVITAASFSPNGKYIVSTGGVGEIFIWLAPKEAHEQASEMLNLAAGDNNSVRSNEEHISKLGKKCPCKNRVCKPALRCRK